MQEASAAAAAARASAAAALVRLKASQETGLSGESASATAARAVAAEPLADGGWRFVVVSDGLTLDQKMAIEQGLAAELAGIPTRVHFRRQTVAGASSGSPAPGPAPLGDRRKSPFGLNLDRRAIPGVTEIIVVASGKGGVGKSTVSVNLAVALAQGGARVGLLDADIYGPSAPLMLGVAGQMPATEGEKLHPIVAHGVKTASFGFLTDTREPVIWRGPLIAKAFRQLCFDVAWGDLDYLIVDLPPGTGDIQLALLESVPVHGAVIVTTPQDVALLDAHKALTMFEKLGCPVLGLVENMAGHVCSKCGHVDPVFGDGGADRMGAERKIPVLARIPLASAVRIGGDGGRPVALALDSALGAPFRELAGVVRSFRI